MRTDYIDLYQLHWPERTTNYFGQLGYHHVDNEETVPLEETLAVLGDLVRAGKVRAVGVSNETPWGVMHFLHLAETLNLPRMASIQNPYSLLNRTFEVGLSEVAIREDCGLLAYGVLASGMLTYAEIADIMEISVEAVESLTARGKRALAAALAGRRAELGFEE